MIIVIILFCIAGFLNAIMDVLKTRWSVSIFSNIKNTKILNWINPTSWENKWKNNDEKQGEKFLGSSTVFVFLMDLWHFSKFLMLFLLCFGITLYKQYLNIYLDVFLLYLAFTVTFQLFYEFILIKKK
jgi:hypothetical protein